MSKAILVAAVAAIAVFGTPAAYTGPPDKAPHLIGTDVGPAKAQRPSDEQRQEWCPIKPAHFNTPASRAEPLMILAPEC